MPASGERMADQTTYRLLACGVAAGPIYIALGMAQVLVRDGFDMRRHALSHLANGDFGWVQIVSFLVTGALVLAGAAGVRRRLHPGRAGTWGPILLAAYGVGLLGAGIFVADPAPGFPPGTPAGATGMSTSGLLHLVFGAFGFYAIIGASLVFARRFAATGQRGWALYSAFTGVAFLLIFSGVAAGSTSAAVLLGLYAIVAWTWIWHSVLHRSLLRGADAA